MSKKNGKVVDDFLRTVYTFSDGTTVHLRGIPPLMLIAAQSDVGKPQPPKRIVNMAGGGKREVERKDNEPVLSEEEIEALKDPKKREEERAYREYRLALAQWENDAQLRMARIVFLQGVEEGPGAEDVALWRAIGFRDDFEIKYAWLASKLRTFDEVSDFFDTVIGLTMPTDEGIEQAEALFQGGVARGQRAVARLGSVAQAEGETEASRAD